MCSGAEFVASKLQRIKKTTTYHRNRRIYSLAKHILADSYIETDHHLHFHIHQAHSVHPFLQCKRWALHKTFYPDPVGIQADIRIGSHSLRLHIRVGILFYLLQYSPNVGINLVRMFAYHLSNGNFPDIHRTMIQWY